MWKSFILFQVYLLVDSSEFLFERNFSFPRVDKEDEMQCLIKGCNFLLKNIPDEAFIYQRHGNPEYKFQMTDPDVVFPYLLVNIGSGVSFIKVIIVIL